MLAFYATGGDVVAVLVNGRLLMQENEILSVDAKQILEFARQEAEAAFSRMGIHHYLKMDERFWTAASY